MGDENDNWPRERIEGLMEEVLAIIIDDSRKLYHVLIFDVEEIVEGLMGLATKHFSRKMSRLRNSNVYF